MAEWGAEIKMMMVNCDNNYNEWPQVHEQPSGDDWVDGDGHNDYDYDDDNSNNDIKPLPPQVAEDYQQTLHPPQAGRRYPQQNPQH